MSLLNAGGHALTEHSTFTSFYGRRLVAISEPGPKGMSGSLIEPVFLRVKGSRVMGHISNLRKSAKAAVGWSESLIAQHPNSSNRRHGPLSVA